MTSFEEKLAARKAAKPRTVDVPVVLDVDAADEIAALESQLAVKSSDKRLAKSDGSKEIQAQIDALRARAADSVVVLRFTRAPGDEWVDLTSKNMARPGVVVDLNYGYNLDAVCKASAVLWGAVVEGDDVRKLTEEQWGDLWSEMSGHEFSSVRDAIWSLNEWEPQNRVAEAKKALADSGKS